MNTVLQGVSKIVKIGTDLPTVMIGERINPTGRKVFSAELQAGDLGRITRDADEQIKAGAAVLDVNVGAVGVDEVNLLPQAIAIVQAAFDVPICIDSANPAALEAGLKATKGIALINSVNGEEDKLTHVLPLVAEYGAAVIALCMDDRGIPRTTQERVAIAEKILERAARLGITPDRVVFDPLVMTISTDEQSALVTAETARQIRAQFGSNMTIGASNASHGMPNRELLNTIILSMMISAGVNAPICNPMKNALAVRAIDLVLGRDELGMQYIRTFRALEALKPQA